MAYTCAIILVLVVFLYVCCLLSPFNWIMPVAYGQPDTYLTGDSL